MGIGIDGCLNGWIVASFCTKTGFHFEFIENLDSLESSIDIDSLILIDMPIGLLDEPRKGGRECDQMARALLPKNRKSSVFSPPIRAVLECVSYGECRDLLSKKGSGLSIQAFHLIPKIVELDDWLQSNSVKPVYEAHPELVFQRYGVDVSLSKKSPLGKSARRACLENHSKQTLQIPPKLPEEDCLDAAILALRSEEATGEPLQILQGEQLLDSKGIPMCICY